MDFEGTNIRKSSTFKNFIVGESNREAYRAALYCANNFPKKADWLWIYSYTGLGNTHLMNAIANELFESQQNLNIKQIHIERFVNEVMESRIKGVTSLLIKDYCELDCLFLDGMTMYHSGMSNGVALSEEYLYNILLALRDRGKLVVFTADKAWHELSLSKMNRLFSLSNCKMVSITRPDLALKKELVKHFSFQKGFNFEDEIMTFIASQEAGNIREIEGMVNRIFYQAKFSKKKLTLSLVQEFYLRWPHVIDWP